MHEVALTEFAEDFLLRNVSTEATLEKIERALALIAEHPRAGTSYAPSYPAAVPPFPCRHFAVPDAPFTLYYLLDAESDAVTVFDVEWSAGDPQGRFRFV